MEKVNCDICKKKTKTKVWTKGRSKRHMDDKTIYTIVTCQDCGLTYTNPRLTRKELAEYYGKSYVSNRATKTSHNAKRNQMYKIEVDQIRDVIKQNFGNRKVKFLDIGASTGAFLQALKIKQVEKYATELTPAAAKAAKKNAKPKKVWVGDLPKINFGKEKFNIVHMRAIFEHVLDPTAQLKKVHRILNKGGILILSTTPNAGSPAAKVYKYNWVLTMPEEHTYYYTNKTINKLFDLTGFKRFKTYYPYLGTPYCSLIKDHFNFIYRYLTKQESAAFWRTAFTIYAKKV